MPASTPASCSDDMYWYVPSTVPAAVKGFASVASSSGPAASEASALDRASPKSSSFAPVFVSITFPGLRSRCTIPCRGSEPVSDSKASLPRTRPSP